MRKPVVGKIIVALLATAAIAIGLMRLAQTRDGVVIRHDHVGAIPITLFAPEQTKPAAVAVIAHGFAGSQQLMQPFALTLARNGYLAITFDFPGHGQNPTPLPADLSDQKAFSQALLDALGEVVDHARKLPESNGGIALLGHSMASDIVVRYAQAHADIAATVAVSLFFPGATANSPRNLLMIDGALEPAMLRNEALRIVDLTAGGKAKPGTTYGDFSNGSARRFALAGGVEHIGVLYSRDSMHEALAWMNAAFKHQGSGDIDARGGALGLLYLGLIALAWPLASLLPSSAMTSVGGSYAWRQLVPIAIIPALLTPLILWRLPTAFLPILLGDYLVLHFALYGLLTAACLYLFRHSGEAQAFKPTSILRWTIAVIAVAAYGLFAIGLPIDRYLTSLSPGSWRAPLILAMLAGTLPYFAADEWLTRGKARHGAYVLTKLCFLLSLVIAVALNLQKLFFLIIIVPVILILFVIYGLFSQWTYRNTGHPLVAACANALIFAWFIAATFPVVKH